MAINSFSNGNFINSLQAAGKNAVINGGMDVWQRGTTFANPALGYTADRWQGSTATAGTVTRVATGDTTNLPNIQYALRYQRTNGATSTSQLNIIQNFESVNSIPLAGKTVTLSFYARKGANYSPTSSLLGVILATGTGTDQNYYTAGYTGQADTISSSATLTTTWQRFTYTATLPSNMTEMAVYFYCAPTGTAGAADYYEITGVQLELGSTATTFSRAGGTIQGELAACQRYYYRTSTPNAANGYVSPAGVAATTGRFDVSLNAPVTMRVGATAIDFSALQVRTAGGSAKTITAAVLDAASASNVQVRWSASTFTVGEIGFLETTSTSGYWGLSAEL
jgi:hypothetical protein